MLKTNQYEQSMEGLRTKAAYSGTADNYETQISYETGKIGAWKAFHGSPNSSTKGGVNKGRSYISAYVPGVDCNKTSEKYG